MGQPRPGPGLRRGRHRARPGRDEHPRLEGHPLGAAHRENKLSDDKRALVNQIARTNRRIGRAWTLKEQLHDVYRAHHPPGGARQYLRRWITAAKRSRINAFVALAQRLEVYFDEVITAIELAISNALIEGINAKIRLINARGYGHHSAQTLSTMIYLCLGGLHPQLPTKT
jgi:transposase